MIACSGVAFADRVESFPLLLASLFLLGSGIAAVQVSANPYILMVGDPSSGAERLVTAQAATSLGMVLVPIFGATFVLTEVDAANVVPLHLPYALIGAVWGVLALFAIFAPFPLGLLQKEIQVSMSTLYQTLMSF